MVDALKDQRREGIVSSHSMILFRQGIEYMESDKFSEALICFEQVYKSGEQVPNLRYACAVAFMKSGRTEDAVSACQSEIAINPDHRDAITLLNKLMYHDRLSWPESTYLVSHKHHFIYCPTSRTMSSTMRKAILKVAGLHEKHGHTEKEFGCNVYGDIYKCASKELGFNTNLSAARHILNDDRYFKFTIVRNPWSRLLSGYLSKMILYSHQDGYGTYRKLARQIRAAYDLSPDTEADKAVTFRQFVEYEARKSDMETEGHWRPQICFIADYKFDFIAKFENIRHDLNYINNKLGLDFKLNLDISSVDYMKNEAHQDKYFCDCYADELKMIKKSCGGFPTYKQFYPPDLKELVARKYAGDIETFEYEF